MDEKIGQLFMVAAAANPERITKASQYTESEIMALIEQYHIGGIIYLESQQAGATTGHDTQAQNIQ